MIEGQKLYLVPFGDYLILKSVLKDPSKELGKIIGDFRFGEEARRKAEKWLVNESIAESV